VITQDIETSAGKVRLIVAPLDVETDGLLRKRPRIVKEHTALLATDVKMMLAHAIESEEECS
jgi:hypothetical protein